MALNPNIALGIQPVQQPNMLGMATQAMALKAAQQDIQGNEELRAAYAQGGDLNDPEFRRRVMAANPKLGSELIKRNAETGKLQNEAIANRIKLSREMLTGVNTPEDYIAWHESNHKDPVLNAFFSSRGITAEQSRAKIVAELSKPGGLERLKKESALGAEKLITEQLQTDRTFGAARISAGPAYARLQFDKEKTAWERANPELAIVQSDNGYYMVNKRDPNSAVPLGMRPTAPPAPTAQPSAVNNMLVTPGVAPSSVNSLVTPAPNQPGAPTVANANALANQPTIIKPKQPIRQPVAVMKDGKAVLVPPEQAVGMQPATAFTEKQAAGKTETVRSLNTAINNLKEVIKPGGLLEQSTGSGLGRMVDASAGFFGQATEGGIAAAKLAPIADLVLKMVPRFEGPQSDKDTQSYKEAAGQLANANLPVAIRKGAAEVIIKLMNERKDQFAMSDQAGGGGASAPADPLGIR